MSEQSVPEEQIVPRGREIYERSIRPELGPKDEGKFVLIDVSGGTYAVDEDFARASGRADSEALCSFARVGANWAPAPAHRIGGF